MRDRPGGEIFISRPGRSSLSAVAWRYALLVELAARFGVAGLEVAQHLGALVVILVLDAGSLVGDVLRVGGEPAAAAGGTGGAEGGFALFYGPLFGSSATAGYLVWRLITFFGPTILAFPMLGLQSHATESIYQRWNDLRHGAGRHRGAYSSKAGGRESAYRPHRRGR